MSSMEEKKFSSVCQEISYLDLFGHLESITGKYFDELDQVERLLEWMENEGFLDILVERLRVSIHSELKDTFTAFIHTKKARKEVRKFIEGRK